MKKFGSKLSVGALVLIVSGVICKVIGALFRLPLTNLLGVEGIGIFQLVMSLYAFALVLTCGGVTNSLSKLISSSRARGEHEKVGTYVSRALFISLSVGFIIGLLFVLLGRYISSLQGIDASNSYMLFLLLLPLGAGVATLRGVFQGYENMLPTAVSQIVEQVFKFVFGLLFAFYFSKIGVSEGVFGAFLGVVLSEVVALVFLFFIYFFKNKNRQKIKDMQTLKIARHEFDMANLPLMLSSAILPLVNAFDGLIIIPRLIVAGLSSVEATQLYGLQTGVVGAILNFPLIISMSVTTALLPNISYLISRGTGGKYVIERGLKILLFLILPTTFGLVAISTPVLSLVYPNLTTSMLNTTFSLMLYGGFSVVFTALMQYFVMLLQANGQFKFILLSMALAGLIKVVISFCLSAVSSVNIYALVLGNLLFSAVICLCAIWKLKKLVSFSVPFYDFFILILSTFAMFLTAYTFVNCNYYSTILNVILAVVLGIVVYGVLTLPFIVRFKPINKYKTNNVVGTRGKNSTF